MVKKIIRDIELKNKSVLMCVDFNVFLNKDGFILDDICIIVVLFIIEYVIEKGVKLILFLYLGCIKIVEDKVINLLKLVVVRLLELIGRFVVFIFEIRGEVLEVVVKNLKLGDVLMFENICFEDLDGNKEFKNNLELGKYWVLLGDVFVNDVFGIVYRVYVFNVGIVNNMEVFVVGLLFEKEINFIGGVLENFERLFVVILGGVKVFDKIEVIKNLLKVVDKVLIGGGMVFIFLKV